MTRTVRVAVFGSSVTALVTGPRPAGQLHLTWPAALARTQVDQTTFDVTDHSRIYGLVTDASGIWADPLAQLRPDVVVLQYGLGETFPRLWPRSLPMHLLGVDRHATPARDRYWAAARRVLLDLHQVERRVDPRTPRSWSRVSPDRFERELHQICRKVTDQIGSRVVLMTAYEATSVAPFVTPHMGARLPAYNDAIYRVAERTGADVFPLDEVVAQLDPRTCLTDGLHMTVDAHRRVGELLASQLAPPALQRASA